MDRHRLEIQSVIAMVYIVNDIGIKKNSLLDIFITDVFYLSSRLSSQCENLNSEHRFERRGKNLWHRQFRTDTKIVI